MGAHSHESWHDSRTMLITGLFHLAIRTANLPATIAFYTQALGLKEVPRPASLKFPGAWFALPVPGGNAVIHVYAGSAAQDPEGKIAPHNEAGVVDHLSLAANGYLAYRERFAGLGLNYREQTNQAGTWQLFVHDPNGLKIELTFEQSAEIGLPVEISAQTKYRAAERFFEPKQYERFSA